MWCTCSVAVRRTFSHMCDAMCCTCSAASISVSHICPTGIHMIAAIAPPCSALQCGSEPGPHRPLDPRQHAAALCRTRQAGCRAGHLASRGAAAAAGPAPAHRPTAAVRLPRCGWLQGGDGLPGDGAGWTAAGCSILPALFCVLCRPVQSILESVARASTTACPHALLSGSLPQACGPVTWRQRTATAPCCGHSTLVCRWRRCCAPCPPSRRCPPWRPLRQPPCGRAWCKSWLACGRRQQQLPPPPQPQQPTPVMQLCSRASSWAAGVAAGQHREKGRHTAAQAMRHLPPQQGWRCCRQQWLPAWRGAAAAAGHVLRQQQAPCMAGLPARAAARQHGMHAAPAMAASVPAAPCTTRACFPPCTAGLWAAAGAAQAVTRCSCQLARRPLASWLETQPPWQAAAWRAAAPQRRLHLWQVRQQLGFQECYVVPTTLDLGAPSSCVCADGWPALGSSCPLACAACRLPRQDCTNAADFLLKC